MFKELLKRYRAWSNWYCLKHQEWHGTCYAGGHYCKSCLEESTRNYISKKEKLEKYFKGD